MDWQVRLVPLDQELQVPEFTATESGTSASAPPLRAALGEYDIGWHDAATSVQRAHDVIAGAARLRARLVVLPEMCTTGFTMEGTRWAEPLTSDSGTSGALAAAARDHQVWLLAGLAVRETSPARLVNAAVLFDPAGSIAAIYRKQ